jgi:hypothetical protein
MKKEERKERDEEIEKWVVEQRLVLRAAGGLAMITVKDGRG